MQYEDKAQTFVVQINVCEMSFVVVASDVVAKKNWPGECMAMRAFAGSKWTHDATMAGR